MFEQSYEELIQELIDACKGTVRADIDRHTTDEDPSFGADTNELANVLGRFIQFHGRDAEGRLLLHRVFGAPGDWGYDYRIGRALQKIYNFNFPRPATDH